MQKKKEPASPPEPPKEEKPTTTSSSPSEIAIEEGESKELDEPKETPPPAGKKTKPGEKKGKAPRGVAQIMLESVFGTFGEFLEILTEDPKMNLTEEEVDLLKDAWAPYLPDIPPWALAMIATASVFSRKAMIFAKKYKKDQDAKKNAAAGGSTPPAKTPAAPPGSAPPAKTPAAPPAEKPKGDGTIEPAEL